MNERWLDIRVRSQIADIVDYYPCNPGCVRGHPTRKSIYEFFLEAWKRNFGIPITELFSAYTPHAVWLAAVMREPSFLRQYSHALALTVCRNHFTTRPRGSELHSERLADFARTCVAIFVGIIDLETEPPAKLSDIRWNAL